MASCAIHLKSRAYIIQDSCFGAYTNDILFKDLAYMEIYQYFKDCGIEISSESNYEKIAKELANHDYHGYASIIVIVEQKKQWLFVDDKELNLVYDSIGSNSTLKYVTKLLLYYVLFEHTNPQQYAEYCEFDFEYLRGEKFKPSREVFEICQESSKSIIDDYLDLQLINWNIPSIDNLIVIFFIRRGHYDILRYIHRLVTDFLVKLNAFSATKSIQELAKGTINNIFFPRTSQEFAWLKTTTTAGCYVHNINPALAIVINHLSFPNENLHLDFRNESVKDIEALQRTFRSKRITYLMINDGSLQDVRAIIKKMRTTNFQGLKYLYIVIMSHGDEGDIIHTKTKSYNIRDEIVWPLLENITLVDVQKFVIVNACRGKDDPRLMNPAKARAELIKFPRNELPATYPNGNKLMMIFSTQKGCVSLRFPNIGSIFVQEFCKKFNNPFDEKTMEGICQETKEEMEYEISKDQIPDFQTVKEGSPHTIRVEFGNFYHYVELMDDMLKFFKNHFKDNIVNDVDVVNNTRKILFQNSKKMWQKYEMEEAEKAIEKYIEFIAKSQTHDEMLNLMEQIKNEIG